MRRLTRRMSELINLKVETTIRFKLDSVDVALSLLGTTRNRECDQWRVEKSGGKPPEAVKEFKIDHFCGCKLLIYNEQKFPKSIFSHLPLPDHEVKYVERLHSQLGRLLASI
jgi:hypothetical protein